MMGAAPSSAIRDPRTHSTPTFSHSELLRAVRGKRSQRLLSKRLGYASNVLYRWETGRAWPAAEDFFRLLDALGQDTSGHPMLSRSSPFLETTDDVLEHQRRIMSHALGDQGSRSKPAQRSHGAVTRSRHARSYGGVERRHVAPREARHV